MNSSAISWISKQGMDGSTFPDQSDFMDSFDHEDLASVFGQELQNYLNRGSNAMSSPTVINIPGNNFSFTQIPNNHSKFSNIDCSGTNPDQASSSAMMMLNFANQNPSENIQQVNPMASNPEQGIVFTQVFKSNANSQEATPRVQVQPTKKKRVRPPSQTYDHIIAERRRREQLSQLFVALSALVPGLKKMDKSSILEDAIKYMKLLQERLKTLEEKAERKGMESVVIVKKSQIVVEDEGSSDEQSSSVDEQPLPEIKARVCDNHIFLRVHCEKQKDVLVNLICKVESLNMIVVSTNATTFGDVALDITIVAEMEKEFNLTMKEVVTALRAALLPAA